jgi:hypothetical protein
MELDFDQIGEDQLSETGNDSRKDLVKLHGT